MVTYGDIKIKKFDIIKLFLYICIVKKNINYAKK